MNKAAGKSLVKAAGKTRGAILYTRVSSDEQAENGTSPDVQRDACLLIAAQMGLPVVEMCPDLGVSGVRYSSRPGIQRALALIEAGEADTLIATKVDRIGRSAAVILDIASRVRQAGGQLVTSDARFDDTPMGQFTLTMFAGMAELERNNIRERTKSGAVRRAQEGVQTQRSRSPFGLHVVKKVDKERGLHEGHAAGSYVPTEDAPIAAEMFTRYAGGHSLREVCRWLNEAGIGTQFGGAYWRPSQLKKVLVNPVYMGKATYGKHKRSTEEVGEKTVLHLSIQETFLSIDCPALVDEGTWRAVQERLSEGRAVFGGNPARRHLLGGLLRCPLCGRGMHGTKREKRTHGGRSVQQVHIYTCPDSRASRNPGKVVCNRKAYSGAEAEAVAVRGLVAVATRPELVPAALAAYRERATVAYDPGELQRVETALRALDAKEQATIEAQVQAMMNNVRAAAYAPMFAKIAEERTRLLARRRELEAALPQETDGQPETDGARLAEALRDVERVLTSPLMPDGEKHDILALVVEKMVPEGVNGVGEQEYRISLRGLDGVEKGHSVRIL